MVYLYKCYFQNYVKESFHRPSETSYYKKLEILYKSVLDLYHRQITFDAENRRHLYRMLGILQENLRYPIQYHIHQNLELLYMFPIQIVIMKILPVIQNYLFLIASKAHFK